MYQDRGFRGAESGSAAQVSDLFVRQTFRFCDREALALFLKGYPSHVVCVVSSKSKFFNFWTKAV